MSRDRISLEFGRRSGIGIVGLSRYVERLPRGPRASKPLMSKTTELLELVDAHSRFQLGKGSRNPHNGHYATSRKVVYL